MRTMRTSCSFPGAKRFFVTGVVRSRSRIPNENHDNEGDRIRVYNRVTVPSHMWTAVCCDASEATDPANQNNGFSFAYIGKNTADSFVDILTVSDLQAKLSSNELGLDRYESVKIFTDDCSENSQKSKRIRAQVSIPMDIRVANAVDSLSRVEQSTIPLKKRKLAHQVVNLIGSKKVAAFNYSLVRLDLGITSARNNALLNKRRETLRKEGFDLLLFRTYGPGFTSALVPPHTELDAYENHTDSTKQNVDMTVLRRRNKYLDGMDDDKQGGTNDQVISPMVDEYLIVPELSAEGSDITIAGDRCINSICGYSQETTYRWCYTDIKKNYDYCCANKCMFRNNGNNPTCSVGDRIRACSIRSSIITVKGNRCLPGHECGLHGEIYYWCYVDIAKNWEYCCQPWHACNKYGETYKWCYAGKNKETAWQKCFY